MIRKILVALDGSSRASGVFAAAVEVAERFGATIHPVRVITVPPEFPAAGAGSGADPLLPLMRQAALDEVDLLAAQSRAASVERTTIKVGQPWRMILEAAEELDVDLIVVGSHGYHGLDRLIGTTAGKVANVARRNVLVVHNRERAPTAAPSSATSLTKKGAP
jgi:nucleotide-binding universal stress UspA family protein